MKHASIKLLGYNPPENIKHSLVIWLTGKDLPNKNLLSHAILESFYISITFISSFFNTENTKTKIKVHNPTAHTNSSDIKNIKKQHEK